MVIIQGVPKQEDKSKVLKHIQKMHFMGCQFDKTDHKCWLFDNLYSDSWLLSYFRNYEVLIAINGKITSSKI